MQDVHFFLHKYEGVPAAFQTRLMGHLANRINFITNTSVSKVDQSRLTNQLTSPVQSNMTPLDSNTRDRKPIIIRTTPSPFSPGPSSRVRPHSAPTETTCSPAERSLNARSSRSPYANNNPALNYVSSGDSGHWSSSSNPPSPLPKSCRVTEEMLRQQTASFLPLWRPW